MIFEVNMYIIYICTQYPLIVSIHGKQLPTFNYLKQKVKQYKYNFDDLYF